MKKNSMGQAMTGKRVAGSIGKYFIMLVVLFISVYPILWVFLSSFKKDPGGLSLPTQWVFDGYITIFTKLNIQTYFLNSFTVTIISTFISVLIVSMSAYISACMQFKGKELVTLMFTTTLFIPSISISFPIYRLLGNLGLKDTRTGLILIYSGLGIAITFFILRSYFQTIPREMEEAAMMDGCGYTKTFFRIIVPIAKLGLATAATIVAVQPGEDKLQRDMIADLKTHKGTMITVSAQPGNPYGVDEHICLEGISRFEAWGIPFIFVMQMIAYAKSILLDRNPDAPTGLDAFITL